jgi:Domain of unknown function (DUF4158)
MAMSQAVEASGGTSRLRGRPSRRRLVKGDGQLPYDEEELARFFTLGPEDVVLVAGTRSDRNRLALALLLTWARSERKLVSDPAALPAEVVAFVAAQLGLSPEVLVGYRSRPATRSAHVAKVCRDLGVRPFGTDDEERLSAFVSERIAHTGNTAALVDVAEDWLVREGLLRPSGETTIERLVYAARAQAEGRLFADIAGSLGEAQRLALDALCATDDGDSVLAQLAASGTASPSAGNWATAKVRPTAWPTWAASTRCWGGMGRRWHASRTASSSSGSWVTVMVRPAV